MFDFLKNIFAGNKTDFKDLLMNGAQIVDVRTPAEYSGGHIKSSKNIPIQDLVKNLNQLNKNKPVITCCARGMRSASAKTILENNGFSEVYNGGGWAALQNKIS